MAKLKDHDAMYLRYVINDARKEPGLSERRIFFLNLLEDALNKNQKLEVKK